MEITNYIFFGDRHLANQYYVVVNPLAMAVLLSLLILPPWIGARFVGKRGIWTAVTFLVFVICGIHAYALGGPNIDEDFAYDAAFIAMRTSAMSLAVVALSSVLAALWLRQRNRRAQDH